MQTRNTNSSTSSRNQFQISKNQPKTSRKIATETDNYTKTPQKKNQFNHEKLKSKNHILRECEEVYYGEEPDDINKASVSTESFQDSALSDGIKDVNADFNDLNAKSGILPTYDGPKEQNYFNNNQSQSSCINPQVLYEKGRENLLYRNLNVLLNTKNLLASASAKLRSRKKQPKPNADNSQNKDPKVTELSLLTSNLEETSVESIQKKILNKLNKEKFVKSAQRNQKSATSAPKKPSKAKESTILDSECTFNFNNTESKISADRSQNLTESIFEERLDDEEHYLRDNLTGEDTDMDYHLGGVQKKLKKEGSSPSQIGDKSTSTTAQPMDYFTNQDWGQYPELGDHNAKLFSNNTTGLELDFNLDPSLPQKPNYHDGYLNGLELESVGAGGNINTDFIGGKAFHDIPGLEPYEFEYDRKLMDLDHGGLGNNMNQESVFENFLNFNEEECDKAQKDFFTPIFDRSPISKPMRGNQSETFQDQINLCTPQNAIYQTSAVQSQQEGLEAKSSAVNGNNRLETLLFNIQALETLFTRTKQELCSLRNRFGTK